MKPSNFEREVLQAMQGLALSDAQKTVLLNALRMVRRIAGEQERRWGTVVEAKDYVQIGHKAIVEAQRDYQPSLGEFATYAPHRVLGAILEAIRKEAKYKHRVVPYVKACELLGLMKDPADPYHDTDETIRANLRAHSDELLTATAIVTVAEYSRCAESLPADERMAYEQLKAALEEAKANLPPHEQRIVAVLYCEDAKTLESIGPDMGWSYSKVKRRHQEILVALSEWLVARGVLREEEAGRLRGDAAEGKYDNVRWLRRYLDGIRR